jgi:hypothetical protein
MSGRRSPRSCAPSISQTAMVNGAAMRGNSENGGRANAPTAPETKAIARRRQPQDRMTPSTSDAMPLVRGRTVESARLKEARLADSRIAIIDHSPNAGCVRLDVASAQAPPSDARSALRLGGQITASKNKLMQIKSLAFACFYFTESGLFKDLRRIQIKFFPPPCAWLTFAAPSPSVTPASSMDAEVGRDTAVISPAATRFGRELHHRREAVQLQLCMIGAAVDRPLLQDVGHDLADAFAGHALLMRDVLVAPALASRAKMRRRRKIMPAAPIRRRRAGATSRTIANSLSVTACVTRVMKNIII